MFPYYIKRLQTHYCFGLGNDKLWREKLFLLQHISISNASLKKGKFITQTGSGSL